MCTHHFVVLGTDGSWKKTPSWENRNPEAFPWNDWSLVDIKPPQVQHTPDKPQASKEITEISGQPAEEQCS